MDRPAADANEGHSFSGVAMRNVLRTLLLSFVGATSTALADGGIPLVSGRRGGLCATLLLSPTSPRVGPVDFSVLVQVTETLAVRTDMPVWLFVESSDDTPVRLGGEATLDAATNKLFRAMTVDVPRAGIWRVTVTVGTDENAFNLRADINIGPALPAMSDLVWWIGWPFGVIAVVAIHRQRVRSARRIGRLTPWHKH